MTPGALARRRRLPVARAAALRAAPADAIAARPRGSRRPSRPCAHLASGGARSGASSPLLAEISKMTRAHPLDDFPLHQTPEPIAHPATGDKNFYDRYFFNGFAKDGSLFFGAALGLYPNRRVMDASFSVLAGGRQLSVHASRLAPLERG
jgi:hypothetical protein